MAVPVIVFIRRLEKGTATAGKRPEIKPSAWHTNGDWNDQSLYAREIYVNTAEGKAFITNDTDIFNLARDDGQHDYVSANTLALEDVFFHKITNISSEIRLINNFIETYFQWRGGSSIVIEVLAGETVKHLYAPYNNAKPIKLACGADYVATQDILIQLVYDSDAEIWKEIGGTTIATVVEPSPKIIYATFQELTNLKAANQIIAGQFYEMTDYATTHEINDSTNTGTTNIHIEDTEPLLLLGLSSNEFQTQVYSKQFPKDIIHYDITNTTCEDGSTPRPGIITYRKDEWENETHFDFRGTKVYDGANNVYIFANRRNPGSSNFYGNKIGINDSYNNYFLFGIACRSNTFGNGCNSNILGNHCYSNIFGNGCYSNTFGNGCSSNTFGDDCSSNTLRNDCFSNTFGNGCYSNILGNGCYSNILGNDCTSNTLNALSVGNIMNKNCSYIAPEALNTSSIRNTTFEADISNITYLATATHLYAAYHKVVFKYPNDTKKLRYFDNSGVLQVVDVNA